MVLEIILAVLLLVSLYVNFNLFRKVEKVEDIAESQNTYIIQIQKAITFSEEKLAEIDARETFKSDDEIGWFFENVKYIQELISNYKINQENEQKK